jgi:hypothetical protein
MARRFLYVSLGVLALALAYNLGASRTEAQGGGTFVGISVAKDPTASPGGAMVTTAITSNGDVYATPGAPGCHGSEALWTVGYLSSCSASSPSWTYMGNVLTGPISTKKSSFGAIKGAYK